ncbi:MAG: protein translocase subunit SecD [Chromatiales bacterium]|nr:protein translocase subunit SecD [Chromatiales bacterium]
MFPSRWKLAAFALIIVIGGLIAAPNLVSPDRLTKWPGWLPRQQVSLGLDLRGGSHLVLEMDLGALAREQLSAIREDARTALREARISGPTPAIVGDSVIVRLTDPARAADAERVLRALQADAAPVAGGSPPTLLISRGVDGSIALRPGSAWLEARQGTALEQSLEVVRRRIDAIGVAEPTVQQLGQDRILVQLPGVQDPGAIRQLLGSTAKLTFHQVHAASARATARLPAGYAWFPGTSPGESYAIEREPMLQGDRLTQASAGFDQQTQQPIVQFRFDSYGAKRFADITRAHVGEPFAIVLDGKVISAPVIREPITGGAGQISGNFSTAEASSLSAMLRAGALPVPLKVMEERTVGADLGADAIRMGATTGVAGLLLVLAFMTVLYGRWGLVANLALLVNVALTLAGLTLLGATLTLPGIAGIVLGIGLAVDANVLINERIREETRKGKSALAAFDAGFKRAYATIVDSNVTTLIATVLLFWFGSGPVRGFAVTMGLGIVISMFTAVSVVRAIMATWLRYRKPKYFPVESLLPMRLWTTAPAYPFMRARFVGLGTSLVLSVLSIGLFVQPGLNYGVDFSGGVLIEARTPERADLGELRESFSRLDLGEVALQEFGDSSTVLVRAERQPGDEEAQLAVAERVKADFLKVMPGTTFERVEVVGPKISGELTDAGMLAVLFASLAMFVYIWVRFEWHFAVGAIATLALDITKTVGFFALTGIEFNLTAIAALLTLIGYSVNDKVVVYDRMRENIRLHRDMPLREIIDRSINETLARSLYTSATAFLAMLPMAVWGGAAVSSFAVPMVFGIVVAASSSVFIAAPIMLMLGDWRARQQDPGRESFTEAYEKLP